MSKNIAILSMYPEEMNDERSNSLRFREELEARGKSVEILFFDRFFVSFQKNKIDIYYEEKKLNLDRYNLFLLVANGRVENYFLVEILESLGCTVKNNSRAVYLSKNKARTVLTLSRAGLPIIPTGMNFSQYHLGPLMDFIGDDEYIYKLVDKSLGQGVAYLCSRLSLVSTFEMMASVGISPARIIYERYIKESKGRDIRVIISGGEIVAAMERRSNGFDFRSNLSGGGSGQKAKLTPAMKKTALKASQALDLDFCGVDLLPTSKGPLVIEVNPNPGLKIEEQTNQNVAGGIVRNLVQ